MAERSGCPSELQPPCLTLLFHIQMTNDQTSPSSKTTTLSSQSAGSLTKYKKSSLISAFRPSSPLTFSKYIKRLGTVGMTLFYDYSKSRPWARAPTYRHKCGSNERPTMSAGHPNPAGHRLCSPPRTNKKMVGNRQQTGFDPWPDKGILPPHHRGGRLRRCLCPGKS